MKTELPRASSANENAREGRLVETEFTPAPRPT